MPEAPILEVKDLKTYFYSKDSVVKAVDGVSLCAYAGRITAVIGGSGSGKSVMSRSIMGLIDEPGKIVGGEVWLNGRDLRTLPEKQMRKVRGKEIAMIFQEPTAAMNPVIKVKNHLFEAARFYERQKAKAERLADFQDVLQRVGLRNPDQILEAYPFELSGGMCQRVMVAMGIIANANVLIADEPTSSLDLTTQASILEELLQLRDSGMAIILITHDLGVVAQTADDMYVIKDGKIVESGSVQEVFRAPKHPYTQYLMEPINAEELK